MRVQPLRHVAPGALVIPAVRTISAASKIFLCRTLSQVWPELPHVHLWHFSRMSFVNTVLSKRKLTSLVDAGRVRCRDATPASGRNAIGYGTHASDMRCTSTSLNSFQGAVSLIARDPRYPKP